MTLYLRVLFVACLAPALSAHAQDATRFPEKPLRIVVGFSPGGLPDLSARLIGQKLAESWKQQVVVDNRAGAGGIIAAQTVANANPDGYTLLSVSSAHAAGPAIYAKLPYDTLRDLAGVSTTASTPSVLVATPALGAKSVKDLVSLARAKPGQILFSSAGVGSATHFSMEMLKTMAGIDLSHVPYKGIPEALTEAMVGRVQLFLSPLINAVPLIKDGKVTALGITTTERHPLLPDVPTIAESGLPGYRWEIWYGLLAPAKTPKAVVGKLNREIVRILALPDVRSRWQPLGVEPKSSTPEQFDALVAEQIGTFTRLARAAGIKAE